MNLGGEYRHLSVAVAIIRQRPRFWLVLFSTLLFSRAIIAQQTVAPDSAENEFPLYLKVRFDKTVKLSSLKPGDLAEGVLARDVYSQDGKVLAAGARVRLTVDHLERRRKLNNSSWPWVVKLFLPRHENFPAFHQALVSTPNASAAALQVSLISAGTKTEVHVQAAGPGGRKNKARDENRSAGLTPSSADTSPSAERSLSRHPTATVIALEARMESGEPAASVDSTHTVTAADAVTLPSGTACHILLLDGLASSKNRAGDLFRARLLEPVVVNSQVVLPAGALFEGKVAKALPPRWLSRAGVITPTFTALTLSDGSRQTASASLLAVELDHSAHTKIDAEGRLHGDRPGVAWMLINGGVTAGIAKEVDDSTQLVIEAILSSATDASTAGTARIVGTIVSSIFMLTRHGRDVTIPRLTEMDIVLNRPLTLTRTSQEQSSRTAATCDK